MKRRRRRRGWWLWRTRTRTIGAIKYAGAILESRTLHDRLLSGYRRWRVRRDSSRQLRRLDLPPFYRRTKQRDVDGLIVSGTSWTVGDFLPEGFEAYLRLPNPFWKIVAAHSENAILQPADSGDGREDTWAMPVTCSEVAQANRLRMTRDGVWSRICGPFDGRVSANPDQPWSWAPNESDIDPLTAKRLFRLLASETASKDRCICGQWEGGSSGWDTDVLLVTRHWNYFVWRARFRAVAGWLQKPHSFERHLHVPHVIWPANRRWFLATLYSGSSNYLAGSRSLIDRVLASDLEAYEVGLANEAH